MGLIMSGEKLEVKQVWHHIEDNLRPSKTQMIRQVMDLVTSEPVIELDFRNYENDESKLLEKLIKLAASKKPENAHEHFKGKSNQIFGLNIQGRNKNQELAFIHDEDELSINIDGYDWPKEIGGDKKQHIKLEIKYFESCPQFTKIYTGYKSYFMIWWPIKPEFTITLPLGMRMADKKQNLSMFCYRIGKKDDELNHALFPEIKLKGPDVTKNEGRNVYTYVIKDKDYKNIYPTDMEIPFIVFRGSYETKYSPTFWGLFFFSIALFIFSIAEMISTLFLNNILLPDIPFLVILGSFSFFSFELKRLNYIIPLSSVIWASIIFSVTMLVLITSIFIINYSIINLSFQLTSLIVSGYLIIMGLLAIYSVIKTNYKKKEISK